MAYNNRAISKDKIGDIEGAKADREKSNDLEKANKSK